HLRRVETARADNLLQGKQHLVRHEIDGVNVTVYSDRSAHALRNLSMLGVSEREAPAVSSAVESNSSDSRPAVTWLERLARALVNQSKSASGHGSDIPHPAVVAAKASAPSAASSSESASSPYKQ